MSRPVEFGRSHATRDLGSLIKVDRYYALILSSSFEQRMQIGKLGRPGVWVGARSADFGLLGFATLAALGGKEKGVSDRSDKSEFPARTSCLLAADVLPSY